MCVCDLLFSVRYELQERGFVDSTCPQTLLFCDLRHRY